MKAPNQFQTTNMKAWYVLHPLGKTPLTFLGSLERRRSSFEGAFGVASSALNDEEGEQRCAGEGGENVVEDHTELDVVDDLRSKAA